MELPSTGHKNSVVVEEIQPDLMPVSFGWVMGDCHLRYNPYMGSTASLLIDTIVFKNITVCILSLGLLLQRRM